MANIEYDKSLQSLSRVNTSEDVSLVLNAHSDKQLTWAPETGSSQAWVGNEVTKETNFGGDQLNQEFSSSLHSLRNLAATSNFTRRHSGRKSIILNLNPDRLEDRKGKTAVIVQAFHEFAGISTFHGLRYVLALNTNAVRRCLWLILVVAFFAIVTNHCMLQYKHFTSKPTSINVNKIYTNYIEFPAVTICNDNVFRISAAHAAGLLNMIEKLFSRNLNLQDVYEANAANMTIDKIYYIAGNTIENMLLSCKWQGKNNCGIQNFSSVLTDYGLCFTFNGPDYPRKLIATSPGSSRGLELVLNIEEYERMAGPNVGSGIHIFVQNKRDYPLVEQKGQAIAAGSHTFIALNLKKEKRLGWPYDNCLDWRMEHVSNVTYRYSMATCKVDCFVTFVVNKCGCKSYYFPGKFPVCTWVAFLTCLRGAEHEYDDVKDKVCKCYNPCNSEYLEPLYSYSALSKDVHNVLTPGDADRIMKRFKWALDINEYYDIENQYKKNRYRNFSQSVNRLQDFYELFGKKMNLIRGNIMEVEYTSNLVTATTAELLTAQVCICRKFFVTQKMTFDLDTINHLLEDHRVFGRSIMKQIKAMSRMTDMSAREVMLVLLKDDIQGRIRLIKPGLSHISQLARSYSDGVPINTDEDLCDKPMYFQKIDLKSVVPKQVLREAVERASENLKSGNYSRNSVNAIIVSLEQLMVAAEAVFKSENATAEVMQRAFDVVENHSKASIKYLNEYETIRKTMIEWPCVTLGARMDDVAKKNKECSASLTQHMAELELISRGLADFRDNFQEYRQIIPALNHYLMYFNVSKFKIAELFSSQNTGEVHRWMERMKNSISLSIDNFMIQFKSAITCYKDLYGDIFKSEVIFDAFEQHGENSQVTETDRETWFNETLNSLNDIHILRVMKSLHTEHLALAQDIQMDLHQFTNQSVIDVSFYSENFIFLNIFFSEISYTITEQQMAYTYYNIISDIGGFMGLLIGGSIVSLFEILDFVICLCVSLLRGTN